MFATKSVFVEEAGLFGAVLEAGDGERVGLPYYQISVSCLHALIRSVQLKYDRASIMILYFGNSLTI
jgi:hypothetical protein